MPSPTPSIGEQKPAGRGRIKSIGTKGIRRNRWYEREKSLHFKKYPYCALCLLDGKRNNSDLTIHHRAGRKGALLWHRDYFLTTCLHHHRYIHDNNKESLDAGWLIHLSKDDEDKINRYYRKLGMF